MRKCPPWPESISGRRAMAVLVTAATMLVFSGCARTPQQKYTYYLETGKKQIESAEYQRAVLSFQNAVQAQPRQADAHYQLALAYLRTDRPKDAIASLRKATELNPGYSPAQLKLAELMIRTRDAQLLQEAEGRIQKILTDSPGDDDALFTLAASRAQAGRVEDAEKYLNKVLEQSPGHLKSAIALALVKVSEHDLPAAEQILKKAVEKAPDSADAAVALGTLYAEEGKWAEAEGRLLKAVGIDPKNANAWVTLGAMQLRMGKKAEAEQTYKKLASLPQTEHRLAYVAFLVQQNRRPEAIQELERMVKADRNDRLARSALVAGYLATNRSQEAESILNQALKAKSNDLEALLQRSQIQLRKGNYEAAEADLDRVGSIDHSSAQAHYLRSKIFRDKRDPHRQKQELFEVLRLSPKSLTARFELADALLMSNNAKAALQTLDEAPASQKRTLPFLTARNWALIAAGDSQTARKAVNDLLPRLKTMDVLLQDAVLKVGARDWAGARASLELALKTNPEDLRAVSLLGQTYTAQNQRPAGTGRIRQLVAEHPGAAPLQVFWAQWLLENNQKAEARQALAAAKAADPKFQAPLLISAGLDFSEGQLNQARSTLTALRAMDPRNTDALMLIGEVEEAANNYPKAIEYYRQLLDIDNRHVGALNNLAFVLSRDPGKLDEAMKLAQKAKELAPESPEVKDTLGWVYYRKGMFQAAATELERALSNSDRPVIQLHLGMTYNRLGNNTKGGRLIAAALAKDPKLAETEMAP